MYSAKHARELADAKRDNGTLEKIADNFFNNELTKAVEKAVEKGEYYCKIIIKQEDFRPNEKPIIIELTMEKLKKLGYAVRIQSSSILEIYW